MVFATFFFSIMQVLVKSLDRFSFFQIIFFRSILSLIICFIQLKKQQTPFFGRNKKLLILRGVFGVCSLSCFFYALLHAPLGTVVTIVNIKPLLILIVAALFLKEKINLIQWFFFIISFAGIWVIKGFDHNLNLFSLLTIIGAALFAAIAHSIIRRLKTSESPLVIILYFSLVTLPVCIPFMLLDWITPTLSELGKLVGVGLFTHFGQLYLTKAYQNEEVSRISNLYYLGIIFAITYGYFLFDEMINLGTLGGMVLVLLGILLNFLHQKRGLKTR